MSTRSLKTRLIVLLGSVVAAIAMVQAAVSYRAAQEEANELLDLHIRGVAYSLRGSVINPAAVLAPSRQDSEAEFDVVVQIWGPDGHRVYQSHAHEALPGIAAGEGFSTLYAGSDRWRVFETSLAGHRIQVAQHMDVRREMAAQMAVRALWPIVGSTPLLLLAVWWIVGATFRPVERSRRALAERDASDLKPLPLEGMPDEVLPLMREFNLLLARVTSLVESQRRFVADASHELRSPLTAMKLQVRAVRQAASDQARGILLDRLEEGMDRGHRLVEQLLALARQENDAQATVRLSAIDLDDVARDVVAEYAPVAVRRSIDLGVVAPCRIPVTADESLVRTMLSNLVDNAIRYTPERGRIDVSVEWIDSKPGIVVNDSGPGIPPSEWSRVFERFYRVPGSPGSGSGIGLAIVKQVAARLGATVSLGVSPLGGLSARVRFSKVRSVASLHALAPIE